MGVRGTRVQCINNQFIDVNTLDHRIPSQGIEVWMTDCSKHTVYYRINANQATRLCTALNKIVDHKCTQTIVKYGYGGVDIITIILSDDDAVTIEGRGMIGSNNCRPTKVSITVSIDNVKSIVNALIAMRDYFVREHQAYLQRAEARKRLCARFKKRK